LKFLNDILQKSETISSFAAQAKQYFQSLPTYTSVVEDNRVKKKKSEEKKDEEHKSQ